MLKPKHVMGNAIKCRVDAEYMISRYEMDVLAGHPVKGLLKIQLDKAGDLIYSGEGKQTLTQHLLQKVGGGQLTGMIWSALQTVCEIRRLGLDEHRMLLNPDWIYVGEGAQIYFIYFPVNGIGGSYDFSLFCRDIILSAELTESEKGLWKQWADGLSAEGIHTESLEHFKSVFHVQDSGERWDDDRTIVDGKEDSKWSDPEQTALDPLCAGRSNEARAASMGFCKEDGDTLIDEDDMEGTLLESCGNNTVWHRLPTIRRLSTGEKKTVTGDYFKIGRSASRADFCVTGNHCISNVHAIIVCIAETYYVKDNYSTNGTYVDGEQISAGGEPRRLADGSMIRMWDEDFEFRL